MGRWKTKFPILFSSNFFGRLMMFLNPDPKIGPNRPGNRVNLSTSGCLYIPDTRGIYVRQIHSEPRINRDYSSLRRRADRILSFRFWKR